MTADGNQQVAALLARPSERPLRGSLRNVLYGCCAAALFIAVNNYLGNVAWWTLRGYLFTGILFAFGGWGAERLWYSTVAPMFRNPFSIAGYATRIPFWYVSGGVSYALGVLFAKQLGVLGVWDTPAAALFDFGGRVGCLVQIPLQWYQYKHLPANDPH